VRKTNSPVEPTQHITSVGLTGDRKKFACAQKRFFQPATFGNLDDWGIKSSPKEFKFWGDEDDDFKNTSPKDFNESPHELRGIGRHRSRSGVFSRTQKLRFVETRDSGEFSTRLDGLEAPQGVTKSSRNRSQSHAQRTKRENQNSSHKRHSKCKIDSNSKAPSAQGGEGLLSRSILVQSLKNPWMKFYPRERKREEQRER